MSFPKVKAIKVSKIIIPKVCTLSAAFMLNVFPVIISTMVNNACPPSKPGIGNKFMKAKPIENKAVKFQINSQFHVSGRRRAIPTGL